MPYGVSAVNNWICLDASLLVKMLIGSDEEVAPLWAQWDAWEAAGKRFAAPTLLSYEVTSALYRYQYTNRLTAETTQQLVMAALSFPIHLIGDRELHRLALNFATHYALPAAYDAHYLALAQRLNAELWTLDRRLHNTLGEVLPWLRTF